MKLSSASAFLAIIVLSSIALAGDDSTAPRVVQSVPETDSTNIDPATTELRVTFDEPMAAESWSWAY